jgi:hypothetical protein
MITDSATDPTSSLYCRSSDTGARTRHQASSSISHTVLRTARTEESESNIIVLFIGSSGMLLGCKCASSWAELRGDPPLDSKKNYDFWHCSGSPEYFSLLRPTHCSSPLCFLPPLMLSPPGFTLASLSGMWAGLLLQSWKQGSKLRRKKWNLWWTSHEREEITGGVRIGERSWFSKSN